MRGIAAWDVLLLVMGVSGGSSVAVALPPPPPGVQTTAQYGIEFSTIGGPGNRAVNMTEAPELYPPYSVPASPLGAVPYTFGLSRTEITASQWVGFVRAYAPYHDNVTDPYDAHFVSEYINVTTRPGQVPLYSVPAAVQNYPVAVSWRYAAIFCNWLTNNEGTNLASFMTGAYDMNSVTTLPNGHWTSVPARLPSARYWIPSLDEWTKAAYYDPNRYGAGLDGYWRYPNASAAPLLSGWPEDGGQTDAGILYPGPGGDLRVNPVASYPSVQLPWGLFGISGGEREWTDSLAYADEVVLKGSRLYDQWSTGPDTDAIWWSDARWASTGYDAGFRLATSIPAPASLLPLGILALLTRRIRHEVESPPRRSRSARIHGGSGARAALQLPNLEFPLS